MLTKRSLQQKRHCHKDQKALHTGRRLTKQLPNLIVCDSKMVRVCHKQINEREKQQWTVEKPKLDNARRLRGIAFIDPEDGEYKETMKNARKSLRYQGRRLCIVRWRRREASQQVAVNRGRNQRIQQNPKDQVGMHHGGS